MSRSPPSGPSGPHRKLASQGPIYGPAMVVTDGWNSGFHRVSPDHAQTRSLSRTVKEDSEKDALSREGKEQRISSVVTRSPFSGVRRPWDLENRP